MRRTSGSLSSSTAKNKFFSRHSDGMRRMVRVRLPTLMRHEMHSSDKSKSSQAMIDAAIAMQKKVSSPSLQNGLVKTVIP